jgi:hypothetical protein
VIADEDFPEQTGGVASSEYTKSVRNSGAAGTLARTWSAAFTAGVRFKAHRRDLPEAPKSFKELQSHPIKAYFYDAMEQHLREHKARRSWEPVKRDLSKGHQVLGCMWVFTYKTDKHGMLQKCKTRLVVCGNQQEPDNLPTRATILAATAFRTLMAIVAKFDLEILQINAVNAFVNADLDELVYMRTPPEFPLKDQVLQLNKALYELQRSPLLWQKELLKALKLMGFKPIPQKPCIMIKREMVIFYFVDDIVFCYRKSAESEASEAIEALKRRFEITQLGKIKWFLELHIIRNRKKKLLWLSQKAYIEKVADRFQLSGNSRKAPRIPIPVRELRPANEPPPTSFRKIYQKKAGSVLYAAIQTRPDIAFAASKLACFNYCCNNEHIRIMNNLILYLWVTREYTIRYGGGNCNPAKAFICHSNAFFANNVTDRKSSQGYTIMLFDGLISYRANRQNTITTLTIEAKLLELSQAAKECLCISRLFEQLILRLNEPLELRYDNRQTIRLLTEDSAKLKTKLRHVNVHNHWLRQKINLKHIELLWESF